MTDKHRERVAESVVVRFYDKIDAGPGGGCHIWTGCKKRRGYGAIGVDGKMKLAHRLSWQIHHGPIPKGDGAHGMCVLHKCDRPECVNPDHLFLGDHKANMADKTAKGRNRGLRGASHPRSKLTDQDVYEIRGRVASGEPRHSVAECFGITYATVGKIVTGRRWGHLSALSDTPEEG